MLKAYKYRLYPTQAQAELIDQNISSCRFVYNLALETKQYAYDAHRKNLSAYDLHKQLPELKKDCAWLGVVDSQALRQSIIDLDQAFKSFFKGHTKFPNFKKKTGTGSFRNPHGKWMSIKNGKLFQAKFRDGIALTQDRFFSGTIRSTTISRTATGKYFVSVLVETGTPIPAKKPIQKEATIGIDLGLTHFAITSDGIKINNPRHLRKSLSHLKFLQRQASKKKKGSANKKKANYKVALQHERITHQRKDFLHKLSTQLINNHDTLCLEDLDIRGMKQNHNLALAISDASWSEFVRQLKYKSEWYGKNILQIGTFQPSTKICSTCNAINDTLTLADREWLCVNCGTLHDRDINAAKNIKRVGLQRAKSMELPEVFGAVK